MFLVDSSDRVSEREFTKILKFIQRFIRPADIDGGRVRIGMLSFSTKANIDFGLSHFNSKEEVKDAIASVAYTPGKSHIAGALRVARTLLFLEANGDRPDIPNVAILLTKGNSNIHRRWVIPSAITTRKEGIAIFGVAIGMDDTSELDLIVNQPPSEYRLAVDSVDDLEKIRDVLETLVFEGTYVFCHFYLLDLYDYDLSFTTRDIKSLH